MGSTDIDRGRARIGDRDAVVAPHHPGGPAPLGWTFDLRGRGPAASRFAVLGAHAAQLVSEFGNLLCAMRGYAQLLAGEVGGDADPAATARLIRRVVESGSEMCARFEAHIAGEPAPESEFDFNGLVVCTMDLVRDLLGDNVRLQCHLGHGPFHVRARPHELEQVVLALLLNARDAMPAGGRLRVHTSRVDHVAQSAGTWPGPWVRLQVRDTGLPFAAAESGARQIDVAHLAEASRVMQRHGGWLRATSLRGRGQLVGNQLEAFLPTVA